MQPNLLISTPLKQHAQTGTGSPRYYAPSALAKFLWKTIVHNYLTRKASQLSSIPYIYYG
mgnify:CR=1 FL=1